MKSPLRPVLWFLVLLIGGSLFGQQQGGFVNPSQRGERGAPRQGSSSERLQNFSVATVKEQADGTFVGVIGFITEQLEGEDDKYLFKDARSNDTIVVEINDDKWRGLVVTPEDQVRIVGKVDKDDDKVEIEVRTIRQFNPTERGRGGTEGRGAEGRNMRNTDGRSGRGERGERGSRGSGRQSSERRSAPNNSAQ